ncbi:MAG: ribonuclease HI family protein [Candidatus Sumerlaeaceae bacterium]|nr:ribonuclease HI family protein [Candidatus Sumerlaeaceae bacterium]
MTLSPELKKLLQQTLKIRGSEVPLHRIMDILATPDGDVSQAINRFRDINDPDLRRAFHNCAVLLREMANEAGLRAAWETGSAPSSNPTPSGTSASGSASKPKTEKKPAEKKVKFRPEELENFEDDASRDQVRVAKVYVDGASKGNPGDAGIGVALMTMDGKKIGQISRAIGKATNNIAEYTALIEAMKLAQRMGVKTLNVLGDSELMVRQMTGVYKIKNPEILAKAKEAQQLRKGFEKFSISYIAREHNALADALSTAQLKQREKAPEPDGTAADFADLLGEIVEDPDEGATD